MEQVSIVVPVYNEEENITPLYESIYTVCQSHKYDYEIIFIDDGSTDGSLRVLKQLAEKDRHVKLIQFTQNLGQTAALSAGFDYASKDIIVTLDGDLQNDPQDIPFLLKPLREGYDVVNGWRKERKDPVVRRLFSKIANVLISAITGVKLNDYGCSLKAYKRSIISKIQLFGEMHRFLPAYLKMAGATIKEIPVRHHARKHGVSKYGLGRIFKVILDLCTAKFFISFLNKPIYIFGGIGIVLSAGGVFLGFFVLYEKFFSGIWAHKNPLLLLAMFLGILGIQFLVLGLMAEIMMRSYYEIRNKKLYIIKDKINL